MFGGSKQLLNELGLTAPEDYNYLKGSKLYREPAIKDEELYEEICQSFKVNLLIKCFKNFWKINHTFK